MTSKTLGYIFSRTTANVRNLGTLKGSEKIFDKALKGAISEVATTEATPAKVAERRVAAAAAVAGLARLSVGTAIMLSGVADPGVAADLVDYLLGEIRRSAMIPAALDDASASVNFDRLSKFVVARMASGEATLGVSGVVIDEDDVIKALNLSDDDYVAAATWVKAYAEPATAAATLRKGRESHELLVLSYVIAAAQLASEPLAQKAAAEQVEAAERARNVALGKVGFFGAIAGAVAVGMENAAAKAAAAPAAPVNPFRTTAVGGGPITKAQSPASP